MSEMKSPGDSELFLLEMRNIFLFGDVFCIFSVLVFGGVKWGSVCSKLLELDVLSSKNANSSTS